MNWSDRVWVELALICYLIGFGYSVYSLATNRFLTPRITFWAICAGFLFTTIFLFDRGHAIGRCPITNRFEVLVFMTWSMVLIYLVIGSTYRLSLMGAFTAPVASASAVFGDLRFRRTNQRPEESRSILGSRRILRFRWWLAERSRLACIAGVMFLIQEQQLKTRQPNLDFFPTAADHGVVGRKFTFVVAGFHSVHGRAHHGISDRWHGSIGYRRSGLSLVWCIYGGILFARVRHAMAAKWVATLSIVAFSLLLSTFWGIRFISDRPSF